MAVLAILAFVGAASFTARVAERDRGQVLAGWWPAAGSRGSGTERGRALGLLAAVAVPVVFVGYFASGSGFFWDDLVNFRQAQVQGLSLHYLMQPTSAHFAPGHRLGDLLLQTFFPMNFPVALGLMLVGFAASLVMFHRFLAQLFGPGRGPLLLTLAFGASTMHVGSLNWWASGLDRLPATILTFVSMAAYVRYFRTASRRSLALSVGALVVALLFYVKPVFVPLYLILMRVLLLEPHEPLRVTLAAAAREWRVWLLYLAPAALYAVIYTRSYTTRQTPSFGLMIHYVALAWGQVVAPGLLGIYIPKHTGHTLAAVVVAGVQVVLAAGLIWTVRRNPCAWRAWAFFAVGFLANAVVVGLTRVGLFGPKFIAYVLYYHLEASFLFYIALGAVLLPVRATRAEAAPPRQGATWPDVPVVPVLVAALAAYLAFGWWGAANFRHEYTWFGSTARAYTTKARTGLEAARAGRPTLALVDGTVPYRVVPDLAGFYNSQSEILPLLDSHLSFDAGRGDLFEVTDDATVRPVTFRPAAGGDARALLQTASVAVVGAGSVTANDRGVCVMAGKANTLIGFAPPAPLIGDSWYLSLEMWSSSDSPFSIISQEPGSEKQGPTRAAPLDGGRPWSQRVFPLATTRLQSVILVLVPGSDICVGRIEVGRLLAR